MTCVASNNLFFQKSVTEGINIGLLSWKGFDMEYDLMAQNKTPSE